MTFQLDYEHMKKLRKRAETAERERDEAIAALEAIRNEAVMKGRALMEDAAAPLGKTDETDGHVGPATTAVELMLQYQLEQLKDRTEKTAQELERLKAEVLELSQSRADMSGLYLSTKRERDEALALLRKYQWKPIFPGDETLWCVGCGNHQEDGCQDDCEWAKLLGEEPDTP